MEPAGHGPGAGGTTVAGPADRVLTVPNAISVARLAGVPVFLWLVLGPHADWWAVGLLIAAGVSDWLDGKLARAWNQQSRLGQVLDPAADRLYIAATLAALAIREIIPWWLVAVLVLRELEGCSYREIAAISSIPIGTVMSTLARARERLQQALRPAPAKEVRRDL